MGRSVTGSKVAVLGLAMIVPLALAACGSGGGSSSSTSSPPAASSSSSSPAASSSAPGTGGSGSAEPTAGSGAVAAITTNWETFFNAKTPTAQRVQLIQNGDALQAVLAAQAANPLSAGATAKVSKVTLTSASQASVVYDVLLNGTPALKAQQGVAVYEGGTWKVGDASFCGLLRLENGGSASGLPPVCAG